MIDPITREDLASYIQLLIGQKDRLSNQRAAAVALHCPIPSPTGPPHCACCVHELHPCPTARSLGVTE